MNILTEYWLSGIVGIFLISMVLYGHYRGFLRLAVTFSALGLSFFTVQIVLPRVTGYLQKNTEIHKAIGKGLLKFTGVDAEKFLEMQSPAQQRTLIEHLRLPAQLKDILIENNNREIYQLLRVDEFFDYVGSCLAGALLNVVGAVVLFLFVYIALRILIHWLDLLARLPVLRGINQIAGAVLGGIEGLLLVWLFFFVVQFFAGSSWTVVIEAQIDRSAWLKFLYENNLFAVITMNILAHIV